MAYMLVGRQFQMNGMNNDVLRLMYRVRDLGLTVDSDLNFILHISQIVHEAHQLDLKMFPIL